MKRPRPSKTPYTRSWPRPKPPPAPDLPTRDSSRKSYPSKPNLFIRFINWLLKFWNADLQRTDEGYDVGIDPGIDGDKTAISIVDRERGTAHVMPPGRPDPRITPTTTHGNYPSTQEQLEKDYDKYLSEENKE